MAAIIDSEHKVTDHYATGVHGFTSGDAPANTLPTELTPTWCGNVQQEINNAIEASGATLNGANDDQLSAAIEDIALSRKPRTSGKTVIFTQFDANVASAEADAWGQYEKTGRVHELTGGGSTFDLVTLDTDDIPDNCVLVIEYMCSLQRATDKTNYYVERGDASFYRGTSPGTSAIGSSAASFQDGPEPAVVQLLEDSNGFPTIRVDPSFLSGANDYNYTGYIRALVVTQS